MKNIILTLFFYIIVINNIFPSDQENQLYIENNAKISNILISLNIKVTDNISSILRKIQDAKIIYSMITTNFIDERDPESSRYIKDKEKACGIGFCFVSLRYNERNFATFQFINSELVSIIGLQIHKKIEKNIISKFIEISESYLIDKYRNDKKLISSIPNVTQITNKSQVLSRLNALYKEPTLEMINDHKYIYYLAPTDDYNYLSFSWDDNSGYLLKYVLPKIYSDGTIENGHFIIENKIIFNKIYENPISKNPDAFLGNSSNHKDVRLTEKNVNFRDKPSLKGKRQGYFEKGETLEILEQVYRPGVSPIRIGQMFDYWYKVRRSNGQEGWVYGWFLEPVE